MSGQSRAPSAPTALRLAAAHRVWRLVPPWVRRRGLLGAAALVAPRPDRAPPPARPGAIAIGGELGRASGLGEGARLMAVAARTLGVTVAAFELGLVPRVERDELGPAGSNEVADTAVTAPTNGVPLLLHANPALMPLVAARLGRRRLRGRPVIGCFVWELPVVPSSWRRAVPFAHAVWTPSRFSAAALEALWPGRVRVVPHPLAVAPPRPAPLDRSAFGLPDDAVVVLASFSLASSFERKNPLGMIEAFRRAFGRRTDRLLLLKVAKATHAPADLLRLRAAVDDAPNIRFELRTLDGPARHALTACADIALSLHRSEGFGLFAAEAMMLGRPLVLTDWSATTEFADADCADPIGFRLVPTVDARGVYAVPGAVWAEPDLDEAAFSLRRLAEDGERRARLGRAAQARAATAFGPHALEAALAALGTVPAPVPASVPGR